MRIGIIVNPVGAADLADQVVSALGAGHEIDVVETTEDDPGVGQARSMADAGVDVVVACGGDGTVRACAEGLVGTSTPLTVAPAGTGNLLALNFDLSEDPEDIATTILDGVDRVIDTGIANGETFVIMAGAGLDAEIMEGTDSESKDRFGPLAYVATAIRHLRDRSIHCQMRINGDDIQLEVASILIGNLGKLQGGVDLFPDADPSDGQLDLLAVDASSALEWLEAARETASGDEDGDRMLRRTTDAVEIEFREPTPIQIDGEERPDVDKLEVSIAPSSLTIRIPREETS